MSFSNLPVEVVEHILTFLDGLSFCVAKEVCKLWNDINKKLQHKRRLWRHFCLKEIPQNIIEEILSFKQIPSPCDDSFIDWFAVYKKWRQGSMISCSSHTKNQISAFYDNPITCIKHSGSWILTGHSNGRLCVWNQESGQLLEKHVCHLKMITDMALVDLLNLGSYYGSESEPWAHHHMITISKDSYIHVKSLMEPFSESSAVSLNYHSNYLKAVRVFGNQFAVSCRDNKVTLWSMEVQREPFFHLKVTLIRSIIGPQDILMNLGFYHQKIYAISFLGNLRMYCFKSDQWLEKEYFKNLCTNSEQKVVCIISYHIFRDQVIIMFTADGKMILSIGESHIRHHTLLLSLQTMVVSVALEASILALGGENGKLYLYHVPDQASLLDLDISKPSFTSFLSEASITSVHISFDRDATPLVTAATTESVYVCKWHKRKSLHQHIRPRDVSKLIKRM